MAGERYVDRAVASLAVYLRTAIPAQLRIVETAQSLAAKYLADPVEVVEARVPDDYRSPLVKVYDNGGEFADHRNGIFIVDCTVEVSIAGDANPAGVERTMRRYSSAVLQSIVADRSLGGRVNQALPTDYGAGPVHDSSVTRQVFALGVEIRIQEQG